MLKKIAYGLASGAVGTSALNLATYLDMALRGRPPSELPAKAAAALAGRARVSLSKSGDEEIMDNRKSALGSLLGYATGLGIGVAYGLVRSPASDRSTVAGGTLVGLTAMAASDLPMALLGLTDPREWDAQSWFSDLLPHLVYGMCTAMAYKAFTS